MGVSIPVLPYFLANAKLLADKVIIGCWKLLGGSNGNLLENTGNVVMAGQEALKS